MKLALKVAAAAFLLVLVAGAVGYGWASASSWSVLSRTVATHEVDFPVPTPLSHREIAELGLDEAEAAALALERAVERGRHLVEARYACADCHGEDFGGGVMVDDPALGRLLGPNLTTGTGSRTLDYDAADWDRIVRHGVRPDGTPSAMPSQDFRGMSDQELSDIVAYIRSLPAVNAEVEPVTLGPLGKVLIATGKLPLSADLIGVHDAPHPALPPEAGPTADFGRHLATTCAGCHGLDLTGGPVAGGDPSWPPAADLTPHAGALGGWTYEQFVTAMRDGRRPDGSAVREPMTLVQPFARNMTEVEMQALWAYLRTLPPAAAED